MSAGTVVLFPLTLASNASIAFLAAHALIALGLVI